MRLSYLAAVLSLVLSAAAAQAQPTPPAQPAPDRASDAEIERRIEELLMSVVRVRTRALPDAHSNATLGQAREGSGVVIDAGYVLTIGYLVIEPDAIEVTSLRNKTLPATLAGYDHATGFGLLHVQGDLDVKPITLGQSAALDEREPVIIVAHGGREAATLAQVMAKRTFTGSWEYLLESAIFTAPATMSWAGAALVNRDLQLVGVGSLLVRDTVEPGEPLPGNMFVPTDLLKPMLADLKAKGRAPGAPRPWLGLTTEEVEGRLLVTRVSAESPAEKAGCQRGDIVIAVGQQQVRSRVDFYRGIWALGAAGVAVPLKLLQGTEVREVRVQSIDRSAHFKIKAIQ